MSKKKKKPKSEIIGNDNPKKYRLKLESLQEKLNSLIPNQKPSIKI